MRDSIPGPWDHDLSRRQTLNHLSHPGAQIWTFFQVLPPFYFILFYFIFIFTFLKILFIYFTERDTVREGTQARGEGEGEGEADFPQSREPNAGLDPKTLGS